MGLALWVCVAVRPAHATPHFVATPTNASTVTLVTPGLEASDSEWARCAVGMGWDAGTLRCTGAPTLLTYEEALAAVSSANSGMPGGDPLWQIPTATYLSSLVLSPLPSPLPVPAAPLLETDAFPDTPLDDAFWTSTPTGYFPLSALSRLTANFADGTVGNPRGASGSADRAYLRLVRPLAAAVHAVTVVVVGNGSVSPASGSHTTSANLVFTATPAALHKLTDVRATSGDCIVDELSSLLTSKIYATVGSTACTVQATFTPDADTFLITATTTPTLSGSVTCPARAALGDDTDCVASPAPGYHLSRFEGCDATVGNTCQLKNVQTDRTVRAVFAPGPAPSAAAGIPTLRLGSLVALSAALAVLSAAWLRRRR